MRWLCTFTRGNHFIFVVYQILNKDNDDYKRYERQRKRQTSLMCYT